MKSIHKKSKEVKACMRPLLVVAMARGEGIDNEAGEWIKAEVEKLDVSNPRALAVGVANIVAVAKHLNVPAFLLKARHYQAMIHEDACRIYEKGMRGLEDGSVVAEIKRGDA